jgi:hydrogenase expression/formation protein HypE
MAERQARVAPSVSAASRWGRDAARIGEVRAEHPGIVVLATAFGGTRIVDMLVGDPLPRIC